MEIVEKIRAQAKEKGGRIVLPEGNDPRMVQAAALLAEE